MTKIRARQLEEKLQAMDQAIKALRALEKEYSMKMCKYAEDIKLVEEKLKGIETQAEFTKWSTANWRRPSISWRTP